MQKLSNFLMTGKRLYQILADVLDEHERTCGTPRAIVTPVDEIEQAMMQLADLLLRMEALGDNSGPHTTA